MAFPSARTINGVNSPQIMKVRPNGIRRRISYAARRTNWKPERLRFVDLMVSRNAEAFWEDGPGGGEMGM